MGGGIIVVQVQSSEGRPGDECAGAVGRGSVDRAQQGAEERGLRVERLD